MSLSVLRLDPTRSASLRRAVGVEIGKWFNELKKDVWRSVVEDDDYGLAEAKPNPVSSVFNAFCPTGEGGGIDNSCSPTGGTGQVPKYNLPQSVKDNISASWNGMNGAMHPVGGMHKVLKEMGHDEKDIDKMLQLFDFHRHGGLSQESADREIYQHLEKQTAVGKVILSQIAVEESLRSYWEDKGRHDIAKKVEQYERDQLKDAWDVGMGNKDAYGSMEEQWKVEKEHEHQPLGEFYYYRKGGLDKDVVATSTNPEGAQAHSVTGSPQPHYKPSAKYTSKEMHNAGYRVLGGYGWNQMGYSGESEVTWIKLPKLTVNARRFAFRSNDDKVREFVAYIGERYDAKVNGKTQEAVLTRYVVTMHDKGMARSYSDATGKERALRGANKQAELMNKAGRAEFLKRARVDPSLVDRVKVLASRTYLDVQGVTRQSADKMRRILVDGMATGTNPREVGRKLMRELDLTRQQAMRIARTEMIRAHAEGQLDAFERLGMKGVMAEVEFSATKRLDGTFDTRVCPACQELDGTLYSLEYPLPRGKKSPRGIIPVHPHCRCAWRPAKDEEPPEEVEPKSRPKPKGKRPTPRPVPKSAETYDDSDIKKVIKSFKVEMFGKTLAPSKPGKTKLIPRKRPKPKTKVKPKAKYLKTSSKTKPKRVAKKKPAKKVTRNAEYDPDLLAFSRFLVNAFCPTGEGGGVDPTCSPNETVHEGTLAEKGSDVEKRQKYWEKKIKTGPDSEKIANWAMEHVDSADIHHLFRGGVHHQGTVYRGVGNISHLGDLSPGREIDITETLSSSRSPDVASKFAKEFDTGSPAILQIKPQQRARLGQDPSFVSIEKIVPKEFKGEKEVVITKGTKLKVIGITQREGDIPIVHLEEVDRVLVNAFCPTGEGGGVDPTCSPSGAWGQDESHLPISVAAASKVDAVSTDGQIPMNRVFKSVFGYDDYSFPVAKEGSQATQAKLDISSLTATQTDLDSSTVKYLINRKNPELPMVYQVGKSLYIKDGHHSIAAEFFKGRKSVRVLVQKADYRPGMSPQDV